jgi:hypothetical protein
MAGVGVAEVLRRSEGRVKGFCADPQGMTLNYHWPVPKPRPHQTKQCYKQQYPSNV